MGRGSVALVSGDRSATRRRVLAVVAATASLLLALAATSTAERHGRGRSHPAFVPPHHRIFHGVTDTGLARDYRRFNRRVGAHSALLESFGHWDGEHVLGGLHRWRTTQTRGVLSISTAPGGEPELISPRRIARGFG